jgi:hypothetical protein
MDEITLEKVIELYDFLRGELPKGTTMNIRPMLSPELAFNIIWFLQEHMGIIPDNFEKCSVCNSLYDANSDGIYSGDNSEEMNELNEAGYNFSKEDISKHFCGSCAP